MCIQDMEGQTPLHYGEEVGGCGGVGVGVGGWVYVCGWVWVCCVWVEVGGVCVYNIL